MVAPTTGPSRMVPGMVVLLELVPLPPPSLPPPHPIVVRGRTMTPRNNRIAEALLFKFTVIISTFLSVKHFMFSHYLIDSILTYPLTATSYITNATPHAILQYISTRSFSLGTFISINSGGKKLPHSIQSLNLDIAYTILSSQTFNIMLPSF